jgi:6-phosphogluconolactonase (cycloisomerase 2 family)
VIYLGGYCSQGGQGIGAAALCEGVLAVASVAGCPEDPTFLAVAPGGRTLYAAHELADGLASAFAIGDDGNLRLLGTQGSGGALPIHVSVHPSGRYLLCANWGSGSFAVLPIDADGALGAVAHVVEHPKPYAHMITTDPAGRWVLAVHYGVGAVFTYHLDLESGRLGPQRQTHLHPGAGPRHLAFHPGGAVLYVVNEADSTVTACGWDPEGGAWSRVRRCAPCRLRPWWTTIPLRCWCRPTAGSSMWPTASMTASGCWPPNGACG